MASFGFSREIVDDNQIESAVDFRNHVFDAVFEGVSLTAHQGDGEGVHVGIIDSVYQPSQYLQRKYDIYSTDTFIDVDSKTVDTSHGLQVFDTVSRIVPSATFSFYQAIGPDGNSYVGPYERAIRQAITDEVDVLNMSLGAPNQIPAKASPYYPPIRDAIDEGVGPVAASGNLEYEEGPKQYVYAPANIPEVVGVGGSETLCPRPARKQSKVRERGPYSFESDSRDRAFCSQRGCTNGEPCIRNNAVRPYPNNTKPLDGKPDVLAPAHHPSFPEINIAEDVDMIPGTSFAAPIVTGTIAKVIDELGVTTEEILGLLPDILTESGERVDGTPATKLDAFNFRKRLESELSVNETAR